MSTRIVEKINVNTVTNKLCAACLRKDGFSFALPHDKGSTSSKHTRIKNIPLIDRVHQGLLKLLWTVYSYGKLQSCLQIRNLQNPFSKNKSVDIPCTKKGLKFADLFLKNYENIQT